MAVEIANAVINLTPSLRGMGREIERQVRGVNTQRAGQEAGDGYTRGFGGAAAKLTGVLGAAFAAVKIKDFAKDAIGQASDLNEVSTKLTAIFGDSAKAITDFGSQGAKALGQTSLEAENAAATFGTFGKAAGLSAKDNAAFSTELAKLATDMASFSNTTPGDAIEALGAGLRGESEPLRRYGVLLDDATLRTEAMKLGLITTTKEALTPQQKVLAAHAVIMKQTSDAQGDFARTSGGLANQQRILSAQWTDAKGKLGQAFLPGVTAVVAALNDKLFPIIDKVSAAITTFWGSFQKSDAITGFGDKIRDLAAKIPTLWDSFKKSDTFTSLKQTFLTLLDTAKQLWPAIKSIGASIGEASSSLGGGMLAPFTSLAGLSDELASTLKDILVPVFDWIAKFMRDNPAVVLTLVAAWAAYKAVTIGITVATEAWAAVQTALNAVMNMSPVMKVVLALTALAAAVVWAYTNVGWFRDAVDKAWAFIKDATSALWEGVLKPAFEWIQENIHYVGDAAMWLWNNAFQPAFEGIKAVAETVFNFLKTSIENAITVFKGIVDFIAGVFTGDWSRAWDGIKQIFQGIWDQMKNIVSTIWDAIKGLLKAGWDWIKSNVFDPIGRGLDAVGQFFSDLWGTVEQVWGWIQDKLKTVWNWIRDNIFSPIKTGIEAVGTVFSGLWTTVKDVWDKIWNKIQSVWQGNDGKGGIKGIWESIKDFAGGIADFFTGIWKGIEETVGKVIGFIADLWGAISGFFNDSSKIAPGMAGTNQNQTVDANPQWAQYGPKRRSNGGLIARADGGPVWVGSIGDGLFRGAGGPRADKNHVLLSDNEYVVNAASTAKHLPLIEAINADRRANGGLIGKSGSRMGDLLGSKIDTQARTVVEGQAAIVNGLLGATANLEAFNNSQDPSTFGWVRAANQQSFSWNGLGTDVAGGTQGLWTALLNTLNPSIIGGITNIGGFENRNNVNNPGVPSFHSFGLAMDVNAPENPNGVDPRSIQGGRGVIPIGLAQSTAARLGMLWGGDFTGTKDPMHFEIHVPPSAINGSTVSGGISTAASGVLGSVLGGSGVERWRSTALAALSAAGQPSGYVNSLLKQMNQESSGDPNAINNTDSNAQRGDPSIGLMQVIGETFRNVLNRHGFGAYVGKGQRDPFSNILASILYTVDTYNDLGFWARNGYGPYDNGGMLGPKSMGVNLLNKPEAVLTPRETAAYQAHAASLANGTGIPALTFNLGPVGRQFQLAVKETIEDAFDSEAFRLETVGAQS